MNNTGVINDPLGHPTVNCIGFDFVISCWTDKRTDNLCNIVITTSCTVVGLMGQYIVRIRSQAFMKLRIMLS